MTHQFPRLTLNADRLVLHQYPLFVEPSTLVKKKHQHQGAHDKSKQTTADGYSRYGPFVESYMRGVLCNWYEETMQLDLKRHQTRAEFGG